MSKLEMGSIVSVSNILNLSIMASTNNSQSSHSSPFIQSHSASLRIWHWLTFLFITASIVTVLVNSTLLSPRDNVKMVQEQLEQKGLTATEDQAFAVSHEYEDKMWEVHKLIGYGLAFLLVARIAIEFTQPEDEKLKTKMKKIQELRALQNSNLPEYNHFLWVRIAYTIFFLILFCLAATGLSMAFGRNLGIPREIYGSIKKVHEIMQYFMYAFVLVHLAGVIRAETGKFRGIVSAMIHGNR
jgi:Ni/Fe-hydrogenase 1 B-type cytochrome subunit